MRANLIILKALYFLNGLWGIYILLFHQNLFSMDKMGHIASASSFLNFGFHQYQDQFFLGLIQNLFYPPLEDALICLFSFIFRQDLVTSYKIYSVVLMLAFLFSIYRLHDVFHHSMAKLVYLSSGLVLFNSHKLNLLEFQGLGLIDIYQTGLTSQCLAGVGLFHLLKHWLRNDRRWSIQTFWLTWIFYSHLIVSIVAGAILLILSFDRKFHLGLFKRRGFFSALFALGLSSAFVVPFLAYREYLSSATVPVGKGYALVLIFFFLFWKSEGLARKLFLMGLVFLLPDLAAFLLMPYHIPFIPFHYYRLSIVGVWSGLLGFCFWLEGVQFAKWNLNRIAVAFLAFMLFHFYPSFELEVSTPSQRMTANEDVITGIAESLNPGRTFIFEDHRNIGFALESFSSLKSDRQFSKGLYWESHRDNSILSSYIGSLTRGPTILRSYSFPYKTCEIYSCYLDSFIRQYNIKNIHINEALNQPYWNSKQKTCFQEILSHGTHHFEFLRLVDPSSRLTNYSLSARLPAASNSLVEAIGFNQLIPHSKKDRYFFGEPMEAMSESCHQGQVTNKIFVEGEPTDLQAYQKAEQPNATIGIIRRGNSDYEITMPEIQSTLFWVKLNYLPGLRLEDRNGQLLPIRSSSPGFISIGRGKVRIRYEKTRVMKTGYWISGICFFIYLALLVVQQTIVLRRTRESSAELKATADTT
jgi:hypothetical protein